MQVPLEISYRGLDKTPDLEKLIREHVTKLEKVCDHMTSCRLAIETSQQNLRSGHPFRVRIDMKVPPGHELVVVKTQGAKSDAHDPLHAVIREAFSAARRQLIALTEKQRGEVKIHPEQQMQAVVVRLFRDDGYGFIRDGADGHEVYFHRNSVVADDWDRLEVGTGVRYVEQPGDKGPQASTVQIVSKPGANVSTTEEDVQPEPPLGWRK